MLIKVCGLTDEKNLQKIADLNIDMIGLNFYPPSKRYLGENARIASLIPGYIEKVGVFVNEDFDTVKEIVEKHNLDYVQLHGDEEPEYCKRMKDHARVIKAFGISSNTDIDECCNGYEMSEFFLFDTKSLLLGGSGKKFDWDILNTYTDQIPFILSGGIGPEDYVEIKALKHSQLIGVDINSKFEISPGIKDVEKLKYFIDNLR